MPFVRDELGMYGGRSEVLPVKLYPLLARFAYRLDETEKYELPCCSPDAGVPLPPAPAMPAAADANLGAFTQLPVLLVLTAGVRKGVIRNGVAYTEEEDEARDRLDVLEALEMLPARC